MTAPYMTRNYHRNVRRQGTIRRVVLLSELLRQSHYPKNLGSIRDAINERTGDAYCTRTIRRDLETFEAAGFATRTADGWTWRTN